MCRSTGALQILHLATCYFRGGYPGQPRTVHPPRTLVKFHWPGCWGLSFCGGRAVGAGALPLPVPNDMFARYGCRRGNAPYRLCA